MISKISDIISYLGSQDMMRYAANKKVLAALAVIFVLAMIFRWKWVLVFLLIGGGSMAIIRYINFEPVSGGVDPTLMTFIIGSLVIAGGIIYLLLIKSD